MTLCAVFSCLRMRFALSAAHDIRAFDGLLRDAEHDPRILRWALRPFGKEGTRASRLPPGPRRRAAVALIRAKHRERGNAAALAELRARWRAAEPQFRRLLRRLFGDDPLPKTPVVYGTVLGIYPRDLKAMTFSVPLKHRKRGFAVGVIAHELLHFHFYRRYRRMHPSARDPERDLRIWHASELFNSVVQSSPDWRRLFPTMPYPEHRASLPRLRTAWKDKAEPLIHACLLEARHFVRS